MCLGQAFLTVDPEGIVWRLMAIYFNRYGSLLVIQIFGNVQLLKIISQIKVSSSIDILIKRIGHESLDLT